MNVLEREFEGIERLISTLDKIKDPCSGCYHASLCAEGYACKAFAQWLLFEGRIKDDATYIPTRKMSRKVFS